MTVTRFAPSPTGWIHIGNLRAALFNYAIARQNGGTFILRLDDTDPVRSKEEYVEGLKEDLRWLGLTWDREERQSLRTERYEAAKQRLLAEGRVYECFETPTELDLKRKKQLSMGKPPVYDRSALKLSEEEKAKLRGERPSHWRFLLDPGRIEWEDGILGAISIDAASVSDPVIQKEDGQWLYTFASSVDDAEMEVTDIVRGADHVTNTATQIQIIRALGAEPPRFAHHSLLTGPQGEGLSKRLGHLSLQGLRDAGLEPMAVASLAVLVGSADAIRPLADLHELAELVELSHISRGPAKFDESELEHLNAKLVHGMPYDAVRERLAGFGILDGEAFWEAVKTNLTKVSDAAEWWSVVQGPLTPAIDDPSFAEKAAALLPPEPWDRSTWKAWTEAVKEATGLKGKALFMPLRRALTARDHGPELAALLPLIGGARARARLSGMSA